MGVGYLDHNARTNRVRIAVYEDTSVKRSDKGNPLDLRAWLDTARGLGELKDVRGADAKLELGAISELNVKIDGAPAVEAPLPDVLGAAGVADDYRGLTLRGR